MAQRPLSILCARPSWCVGLVLWPGIAMASAPDEAPETEVPEQARLLEKLEPDPSPDKRARVRAALGEGMTAESRDGSSLLNIRARMQVRATHTSASPHGDPPSTGFMIRRARLVFQGHVFSRDWEYYLQLGFSNLDMEPDLRIPLRDAAVTWTRLRDFNIRAGQMKVPFDRQRVISSSALMFADRSIVTQELNLDRDVGVQALSRDLFGLDHRLGYQVGVFGGDGRNRIAREPGVLVVGRIQVSPFGGNFDEFDDYSESVPERPDTPKLAIGGGVAYNRNSNRSLSTFGQVYRLARFDHLHGETDLIFKWRGWSMQAQWLYRKADRESESGIVDGEEIIEHSRSGWGWFAQGGYQFPFFLELSTRYGELYPLGPTAIELRRELGPGISYYFQEHALKLQADYFYLFGPDIQEGRHEARIQMQLFF
jgi:phosphate-selective porin OprO and OprP